MKENFKKVLLIGILIFLAKILIDGILIFLGYGPLSEIMANFLNNIF